MYLHIHERKSLSFFFLITVVCRGCGGFVIVICFLWHSGSFFPECRPPKIVQFGVNMNALACKIAHSHHINAYFTSEDACATMPGLLQKESGVQGALCWCDGQHFLFSLTYTLICSIYRKHGGVWCSEQTRGRNHSILFHSSSVQSHRPLITVCVSVSSYLLLHLYTQTTSN